MSNESSKQEPINPEDIDRVALSTSLRKYFNRTEMKGLAYSLGLESDELPDVTRSKWAIDLVEYSYRHGKLKGLIYECEQLRPHAEWRLLKTQSPKTILENSLEIEKRQEGNVSQEPLNLTTLLPEESQLKVDNSSYSGESRSPKSQWLKGIPSKTFKGNKGTVIVAILLAPIFLFFAIGLFSSPVFAKCKHPVCSLFSPFPEESVSTTRDSIEETATAIGEETSTSIAEETHIAITEGTATAIAEDIGTVIAETSTKIARDAGTATAVAEETGSAIVEETIIAIEVKTTTASAEPTKTPEPITIVPSPSTATSTPTLNICLPPYGETAPTITKLEVQQGRTLIVEWTWHRSLNSSVGVLDGEQFAVRLFKIDGTERSQIWTSRNDFSSTYFNITHPRGEYNVNVAVLYPINASNPHENWICVTQTEDVVVFLDPPPP